MVTSDQIVQLLKQVKDPEVPVLDVVEMGVVREIDVTEGVVTVKITPTYTGCPAMKVLEEGIIRVLREHGFSEVLVETVLSPPWTTDWLSDETKQKLKEYGIAPPGKVTPEDGNPFRRDEKKVSCPFCDSQDTSLTSQFGSTACKALYYCNNCQQPFEHFKCI